MKNRLNELLHPELRLARQDDRPRVRRFTRTAPITRDEVPVIGEEEEDERPVLTRNPRPDDDDERPTVRRDP